MVDRGLVGLACGRLCRYGVDWPHEHRCDVIEPRTSVRGFLLRRTDAARGQTERAAPSLGSRPLGVDRRGSVAAVQSPVARRFAIGSGLFLLRLVHDGARPCDVLWRPWALSATLCLAHHVVLDDDFLGVVDHDVPSPCEAGPSVLPSGLEAGSWLGAGARRCRRSTTGRSGR